MVVATAGHKSDIDVVIQAMRAKPAYLAAWARAARPPLCAPAWSRRALRRSRSTRLHLPIGVAIEAEDPEEIAISIAAEMIHLRRTKLVPRKR
mgnify:CR=1 FL=1